MYSEPYIFHAKKNILKCKKIQNMFYLVNEKERNSIDSYQCTRREAPSIFRSTNLLQLGSFFDFKYTEYVKMLQDLIYRKPQFHCQLG